jgi:sulfide:quinone oxidoreductase
MHIIRVNDNFSITKQVMPSDIKGLAEMGYKAIINNRPDYEQVGQPLSESLQKAADDAGVKYHHIPVSPGKATLEDTAKFKIALAESPAPILAFCKSGMRAKALHAACQPNPDQKLLKMLYGPK